MNPMIARRDAAQAACDRFAGARLRWSTNDCTRLAAFTVRKLGHKPPMPKAGSYRTLEAGAAELARNGFASLEAALDSLFPRIPPAAALPGDIIAMPCAEPGWVALAVALGNGRQLGFVQDPAGGAPVCKIHTATFAKGAEPLCAWRVDPCRR